MKTGYLIDMDGVIYRENMNTADFLSETDPNCTVYVIGEGGLLSALHERKIPSDAINPRYVVVGEGTTTMEKLIKAHECLERGARLLVTNPDNWCPVAADKTRPGAGATAALLEASTGRRAYFLGKPNGYMFHRARRKLAQLALAEPEEVVMIGDTMETDIRGAVEAGLHAFLVLSGSTSLEEVQEYVYQPTRILNSIADLTEEIITGRPSDRLDSPALQSARPDQRSRFAHGQPAAKHRPRPAMTR